GRCGPRRGRARAGPSPPRLSCDLLPKNVDHDVVAAFELALGAADASRAILAIESTGAIAVSCFPEATNVYDGDEFLPLSDRHPDVIARSLSGWSGTLRQTPRSRTAQAPRRDPGTVRWQERRRARTVEAQLASS
ncbi:MAG: hypothetical protein ACRDV9_05565, partial [Acidimicrobiia bacterium]